MMSDLLYKEEVYAIVGAAMEVHRTLGCGFLEAVYQEAMEMELIQKGIPFVAQQELTIFYKGKQLRKVYIADLVAYGKIIIEIKAIGMLTSHEGAQVINYLKATGIEVGVLINFGAESLQWERKVLTKEHKFRENSRNSWINKENV